MTEEQIRKSMEGQFNLTIFLNNLAKEEEALVSLNHSSDFNVGRINLLNDIIEALEGYTSLKSNFNRKRISENSSI